MHLASTGMLIMTNQRYLVIRNKRDGFYRGYLCGHMRTKDKWASLKGKPSEFFAKWMESIGLGGRYE
jgi:hypothetical protein